MKLFQIKAKIKSEIRAFLERHRIYIMQNGDENFITYHFRPKKTDKVYENYSSPEIKNVGIVIQGPLRLKNDFTLETVKLYRRFWPNCEIILSTWENEDEQYTNKFLDFGVHVIRSKILPENLRKFTSVNQQLETSLAGIKKAKALGCEYVAKTRTDYRIYSYSAMGLLLRMIDLFPLKREIKTAKKRIIACSVGTFSNRHYNVSDLFLFGTLHDIERYFSCPQDTRDHKKLTFYEDEAGNSKNRFGEIWFATHYLELCGNGLLWTQEDSDNLRNDYFIIVDNEMLDLFWDKYTILEYRWRNYLKKIPHDPVTFADWLLGQKP